MIKRVKTTRKTMIMSKGEEDGDENKAMEEEKEGKRGRKQKRRRTKTRRTRIKTRR